MTTHDRIIAVLEARMGSSRLPGKSIKPLAGRPLVQRVIERLRHAKSIHGIVLATSTLSQDDVLIGLAESLNVPVFRGSETDVLARILGAAQAHGATIHVQCWGDCPFLDAGEIDRTVTALCDCDVSGNGLSTDRLLPYGLDVIVARVAALERAERETRGNAYHREHGTTYLYQNPDRFRIAALETPPELRYPSLDLTVNTVDDLAFVDEVYCALGPRSAEAPVQEILAQIRANPALLASSKAAPLRDGATRQ